jgi:hypothetical protein
MFRKDPDPAYSSVFNLAYFLFKVGAIRWTTLEPVIRLSNVHKVYAYSARIKP